MIKEIEINDYKRYLGGNSESHSKYAKELKKIMQETLVDLNTDRIKLYDIRGERHSYTVGREYNVVIFVNGTENRNGKEITLEAPLTINRLRTDITKVYEPKGGDDVTQIKVKDVVVAEWVDSTYQLNILMNLFEEEYNAKTVKIFKYIMEQFNELVWKAKLMEFSWKYTNNKEKLTNIFTRKLKDAKSRDIRSLKNEIDSIESKLRDYKRSIKNYTDSLGQKRRAVDVETANLENVSTALINDFDLIIQHEKVKDFQVKDGILTIYTVPLYIYSDKGKKYYGGNYKIEINMDNTDVRFFGDNPRKSYWSEKDPHPHVNGRSGEACLGNVSSTIAELCSQMQAYALVMICIDFLEAANTGDAAGRNVVNWDEIVEEKVIPSTARENENDDDDDDDEEYDDEEEAW